MAYPTCFALLNHLNLDPAELLQMSLATDNYAGQSPSPSSFPEGLPTTTATVAAAQLAIDEALLDAAEAGFSSETLRIWQFSAPTAVLGRGSKFAVEIDEQACATLRVPVLRRCSGGASIVAGPGCLMYSVVLDLRQRAELRRLDAAHQFIMSSLQSSLEVDLPDVKTQGTCDLTWRNRKFSGNSLRVARDHLLYHGTLLYDADLALISRCLKTPPRQPEYRHGREHASFITNIPLSQDLLVNAVVRAFAANAEGAPQRPTACDTLSEYLVKQAAHLLNTRYSQDQWTKRH